MNVLVTGGAGFIGSNLVRRLVDEGYRARVLDDLSTGSTANLEGIEGVVELVHGDVRDPGTVARAAAAAEVVYHLAALPSVARSVADPVASHQVNVTGTLNVLVAAREAGVRRVVYASSSSVYGDTPALPKREQIPVHPRSPYAASKLAGEAYCRAFTASFGLETVSLRFFNVFGPRQDPASQYAAVIPSFASAMLKGRSPTVFGDGTQSRDFTFVANALEACVLAGRAGPEVSGKLANVACGGRTSLLDLVAMLNQLLGTRIRPRFAPPRPGDIRHSQASIDEARRLFGYRPVAEVREGLAQTLRWLAEDGRSLPAAAVTGAMTNLATPKEG